MYCSPPLSARLLTFSLGWYSTVPTKDQVLVPETLLKKRKTQQKDNESRAAELQKKRDVSLDFPRYSSVPEKQAG